MLDYAANGIRYWPMDALQGALEVRAAEHGTSIEELVKSELESDLSVDELMSLFHNNLRAGNVRLLFVADALPDRLCRIIEFLNEQMTPTEVLGVEVRQYTGDGHTVYVPRVVGRTATARASKSTSGKLWDRDSLLDKVEGGTPANEVELMKRLLDHAQGHGSRLSWGKGTSPGVSGWYDVNGVSTQVWVLRTNSEASGDAYLSFYFADLARKAPPERIEAMAQLLATIPDLAPKIAEARDNGWKKWPSVYLKDVAAVPERVDAIFQAVDGLLAESPQPAQGSAASFDA